MTSFKFCGLSTLSEVEQAAEVGAAYVGFVVHAPKSHRDLPIEEAARLAEEAPASVDTVLVTPSDDADLLADATASVEPSVVQLTGDPPQGTAKRLRDAYGVDLWRGVSPGADVEAEAGRLAGFGASYDALVLDHLEDSYGGTGERVDWTTARALVDRLGELPVVLAGGLTPENVGEAIAQVRPWCVDVSSGIETGERKDPDRMRAFALAVRENREVNP